MKDARANFRVPAKPCGVIGIPLQIYPAIIFSVDKSLFLSVYQQIFQMRQRLSFF